MWIVSYIGPGREPVRLCVCDTFAETEANARAAGAVGEPTRDNTHDTLVYAVGGYNRSHAIWIERV
jgi:hypothetical protein